MKIEKNRLLFEFQRYQDVNHYTDEYFPQHNDEIIELCVILRTAKQRKYAENIRKELEQIVESNTTEETERILYETDKIEQTPLLLACRYGLEDIAIFILEHTHKESNIYKRSIYGQFPLRKCLIWNRSKLDRVFDKIIEKTQNEDYFEDCLHRAICIGDNRKASILLNRTQKEENLYKLSMIYTPLYIALETKEIEIAMKIIEKTQKQKSLSKLSVPDINDIERFCRKTIYEYIELPEYQNILVCLNQNKIRMDKIRKMKVKLTLSNTRIPEELYSVISGYLG